MLARELPETSERLSQIDFQELRGLIVDAWLARAPKRLADRYAAEHS